MESSDAQELLTEQWFDACGQLRRKEERGAVWSWDTDGLGRVVAQTDPLGNVVQTEWGLDGRVERVVRRERSSDDPTGPFVLERWTRYVYDARGRLRPTEDEQGRTTTTEYDARDVAVAARSADQVWRTFGVGLLGERVAQEVDPGGLALTTAYGYDELGRPMSFTDGTTATTSLERDRLGRVRKCRRARFPSVVRPQSSSVGRPGRADGRRLTAVA